MGDAPKSLTARLPYDTCIYQIYMYICIAGTFMYVSFPGSCPVTLPFFAQSVKDMLAAMAKVQPEANDDVDAAQAALCALFRSENLPSQRVSGPPT